mgnify:CR=1 FL=1
MWRSSKVFGFSASSEEKNMSRKRQVKEKSRRSVKLLQNLLQRSRPFCMNFLRRRSSHRHMRFLLHFTFNPSLSSFWCSKITKKKRLARQKRKNFWEGSDTKKDKKNTRSTYHKKRTKSCSHRHMRFLLHFPQILLSISISLYHLF